MEGLQPTDGGDPAIIAAKLLLSVVAATGTAAGLVAWWRGF